MPVTIADAAAPLAGAPFWTGELLKVISLYAVSWLSAQLVIHHRVRVNYTRKINHFALFFMPMLLTLLIEYERTFPTAVVSSTTLLLAILLMTAPVRRRIPFFATAFRSFDRPEDRPNTMVWLITQIVAGYIVLAPLLLILDAMGAADLVMIPVLINAVGDGLAEPVGVRFGRHTYQVTALGTSRTYTRSIEGSACVFASGIGVVLFFASHFTGAQLVAALIVVPLVTTLAEAWSPHTWDTPFLFLTGSLAVLGVLVLV